HATERAVARSVALPTLRVNARLYEVADAEIRHVRDGLGAVVVTEFGGRFLAGIHARDSRAAGVMGRPLGDVIDFPRDDDPAIVPGVVPGDFFARHRAWRLGRSGRRPEFSGDRG